jgi:GTP pyrophosphokinase
MTEFEKSELTKMLSRAHRRINNLNESRVKKAFEFAAQKHGGQKRASGEDYISHPIGVANILLDFSPDEDSLIAALLHDVTEDCGVSQEELEKRFGATVMKLVSGLEKLSRLQARGESRQVGSLRKMFLAMARDVRVVLIKLCDRLHNMQTLHFLKSEKQIRIAEETLQIYAPIAARLGIFAIKGPLEDLSFFYLWPEKYEQIAQQMKKHEENRTRILKSARKTLWKILKEEKIIGDVVGRVKHFYSIFKKMRRKDVETVDELYDLFAVRIIVPSISDCYAVLGRVHQTFTPLSKRFKDYIAVPKPNGYRSLHTTVIGISGAKTKSIPVEIQIRTQKMQIESEFGVAAHWSYKENKTPQKVAEKSNWIKSLVEIEETQKDNQNFLSDLKIDTFSDRIFVLTPNGEIRDLPAAATPIDFAFSIHTKIGLCTRATKINGKIAPLNSILKNGDVVEILKSKTPQPHQNWISFTKTSLAKNQIRRFFSGLDREKILRDGREILNKSLERFSLPPLDPHLQILKDFDPNRKTLRDREEILEHVGNGSLSSSLVVKKILKNRGEVFAKNKKIHRPNNEGKKEFEILVDGQKGIPLRSAGCCKPKPFDPIVGFATRGT